MLCSVYVHDQQELKKHLSYILSITKSFSWYAISENNGRRLFINAYPADKNIELLLKLKYTTKEG